MYDNSSNINCDNYEEFCNKVEKQKNIDNNINPRLIKKHFLCMYPFHDIPTFIIENTSLKISCRCGRYEELSYKDALKIFVSNISENTNLDNYYKCQKKEHREKKFKYFCFNCNRNLCKLCLRLSNYHKNHKMVIFENEIQNTKTLAYNINEKLKKIKSIEKDLKDLFNVIFDNFSKYPNNYSYIDIFNEYNNYLKKNFPNEV